MPIQRKSLNQPDTTERYADDGEAEAVQIGDAVVWRSRLKPGWSWDKNAKPKMGLDYCPADHFEYVVSGRITYRMAEGGEVEGKAGDFLIIGPGHAGEVVGDELCVLIDW